MAFSGFLPVTGMTLEEDLELEVRMQLLNTLV